LKSPNSITSSLPEDAFSWLTNATVDWAWRTRSPLYGPCPSPVSTLSPVGGTDADFDFRWLATTVNFSDPDVKVCAIGSRALDHTVSSLIVCESPAGVTLAGLKMMAVVMKSCWAGAGRLAGERT
jgi:hypothetical protein